MVTTIYFIQCTLTKRIKIGISSDLPARLKNINQGMVAPVTLLGHFQASYRMEGLLHERFAHLRRHMEWFEDGPDLVEYIESQEWEHAADIADQREVIKQSAWRLEYVGYLNAIGMKPDKISRRLNIPIEECVTYLERIGCPEAQMRMTN